jgi:CRP/FNR family cyclic AMP-dependent transcriptional regulator
MMDLVNALASVPAFARLAPADFEALRYAFLERAAPAGTELLTEGNREGGLLVLLSGKVATHRLRGSAMVTLSESGPGALLGVVSLVDTAPRSATCTGVTDVRYATLTPSAALLLMNSHEALSLALYTAVGNQLAADVRRLESRLSS